MRPDDIIARLGGDEFAVFLPHTSYESIRKIASRIQVFFDEKFTINIDSHYDLFLGDIKTEIAVSVFPDGAKNAHELLHNADIAMQHGPATIGENLYFYHEKMSDLLHEKQNMTIALTRALSLVGQLYPAYQAIVDKDGKAESFESLIRWNHPDK